MLKFNVKASKTESQCENIQLNGKKLDKFYRKNETLRTDFGNPLTAWFDLVKQKKKRYKTPNERYYVKAKFRVTKTNEIRKNYEN